MRIALSFLGIFLSFVVFAAGNMNTEKGCGKNVQSCFELCHFCDASNVTRMKCYEVLLRFCYSDFGKDLDNIDHSQWCMWNNLKSHYNNFTLCTETFADCLRIPWPNQLVEDVFVEIHTKYFKDCPMTKLADPPPSIIFALVMTPICLIPVMVVLVVLKTKNGDSTS